MINVIKRNGTEVPFDKKKIVSAICRANAEIIRLGDSKKAISQEQISTIANRLTERCRKRNRATSVEEIQDMVQTELIKLGAIDLAILYIKYRYDRELARKNNTTDSQIISLVEGKNEEIKQENSNKNPTIVSVQRDYIAGEVSKDITRRNLLPSDVVSAHDKGIIHFHDADYFLCHEHNCDLVNLEDMLQNGTVISETMIEKPHTFSTACNIATQVVAQVASSQYGLN